MNIRRLTPEDLPRLRDFWIQNWGGEVMIVHGTAYRPEQLEGFIVTEGEEWLGLLTFVLENRELEVISLDSLREGQGFGSRLLDQAIAEAHLRDCRRVFLITTNDNLHALGFYQRRGFELVRIDRGAVNVTRDLKPSIPLRDEIELELVLDKDTQVHR
jgi:ribosomal protein S18 acetylase RimI-like enzyme